MTELLLAFSIVPQSSVFPSPMDMSDGFRRSLVGFALRMFGRSFVMFGIIGYGSSSRLVGDLHLPPLPSLSPPCPLPAPDALSLSLLPATYWVLAAAALYAILPPPFLVNTMSLLQQHTTGFCDRGAVTYGVL